VTLSTQTPVGFWRTVRVLLGAARRRGNGRRRRQRELLAQRTGKQASTDWSFFGVAITVLFMAILNVGAGIVLIMAVDAAQRVGVESRGKIIVDGRFYRAVENMDAVRTRRLRTRGPNPAAPVDAEDLPYQSEASNIARRSGGSAAVIEQRLRHEVQAHGAADLVPAQGATPGMKELASTGPVPMMFGSFIVVWWGIMLVFQGEGLELDIQRRRHPLWEWVFSHPVPNGAVFLAEILTPIAANPVYWTSPLFPGIVYGAVYGPLPGLAAVLLAGIPITVAAACLGKAIEIGVILRFSSRTRGAAIGLMSWIGYSTLMLFFLGIFIVSKIVPLIAKFLTPVAPPLSVFLRLFLGGPWSAAVVHATLTAWLSAPPGFSFFTGVLSCWLASLLVIACAVWFTVWGAQRGLAGVTGDIAPVRARSHSAHFGREPLYRKEFLWFVRDRSAIVQTILIPLTVAGFQMFNLRGLISQASGAWNYLCGAAIFFGTYVLWVLGPKSLASEGQALWIALTWPQGLESLLKAKAWLWSLISSGMVFLVLAWAAFLFPAQIPQIALVGVGWWFFGRSMAEKSVTLVTIASSSGEPQPLPRGRRAAAQLGMLTFALGVITRQWNLAIVGIVFSWITAAAMWQNFRARLPYLYDPWSETLPAPPTLMHAMVAISLLIEGSAVLVTAAVAWAPRQDFALARAMAYAIAATVVFLATSWFLSRRGVEPNQVWTWIDGPPPRVDRNLDEYLAQPDISFAEKYGLSGGGLMPTLLLGLGIGLVLGGLAFGYTVVLRHIPALTELLRNAQRATQLPGLRVAYAIMAVGFAPFAEEYLFRGLLYRALDRDWGGWRAVLGAAAFFTVYHPLLAWPPVFCVGAVNCLLFKKTRRLLPCIVLHMTYNAVLLLR
jgi:membrane protease YdiL (CAAX protease family)